MTHDRRQAADVIPLSAKTLTMSPLSKVFSILEKVVAEQDKGMELGASGYLVKPILEDDLVHALEKLRNSEG